MKMDLEKQHFGILARYNGAANKVVFQLVDGLPPEERTRVRGSYFGSLLGVLGHILLCDINWLRRFRVVFGEAGLLTHPRLAPSGHVWTQYSFGDFETLSRERALVDGLFIDWVACADTGRFGETLAYTDSRGTPCRYVFREALDHVFNHQTHHRGQVSQILDELGVIHDFSNILGVLESPSH